ncbi:tetratricopeptide (TPR) repeat protein [Salinibacter ruber]|uniref:RagB/SusD family nutrient uptake outer membrane protein n=1 Tax=Salinibacter ruber TaxID=146919 RepID=UPI002169BC3B|nr:RagB/SusD family nutrient uptake outer membrane protein [Salinibacter ruber]MCS3629259.1 tetratricopeptide (TPR) repeat protein [Salinibacter ruber]MCS3827804.1 tetratricopeptide (TPR) repeat protein [Salinibacter ruber]MCS4146167.1 tetratricopeptide (TPR) repeat protein [Salinibacter ruber]
MLDRYPTASAFARGGLLIGVVALLLVGCDSFLSVDPQQSIDENQALSTPQNVRAVLVGAYDDLSDVDLYGGQYMMSPDLLADNGDVQWDGTFAEPAEIVNKQMFVNNGFIESQWTDAYQTINTANNVLNALSQFSDPQERARIKGEALFIRGALYFELVRLFGQPWNAGDPASNPGVPLVLEPTRGITEDDNVTRDNVQAVYNQVITDLTTARDSLPATNGVFANSYAASAFLSRVYLMQGEYEAAAQAANRVIQSDQFSLAPTFAEAFNNSGNVSEYIFAIEITPQDGGNDLNLFYASEVDGGRGDINIQQQHLDRYADGDARGEFFYEDAATGDIRTQKWRDDEADGANIPVVRYAEMFLTRAEANLRAGTTIGDDPVDDVNEIRERAGLSPTGSVTVEDVLRQRRLEFAFEGNLLHDLKRTGRSVGSIPFDANRLVYPIPQREIDSNPEIQQNPGYGGQ